MRIQGVKDSSEKEWDSRIQVKNPPRAERGQDKKTGFEG